MFGGTGSTDDDQPVLLDELVLLAVHDNGALSCCINPSTVSGPRPCARSGATLLEYAPGQLLLYGGFDADGKPLDDAFLFDVNAVQWSKVYSGHPDFVGQEGEKLCRLSQVELPEACSPVLTPLSILIPERLCLQPAAMCVSRHA